MKHGMSFTIKRMHLATMFVSILVMVFYCKLMITDKAYSNLSWLELIEITWFVWLMVIIIYKGLCAICIGVGVLIKDLVYVWLVKKIAEWLVEWKTRRDKQRQCVSVEVCDRCFSVYETGKCCTYCRFEFKEVDHE